MSDRDPLAPLDLSPADAECIQRSLDAGTASPKIPVKSLSEYKPMSITDQLAEALREAREACAAAMRSLPDDAAIERFIADSEAAGVKEGFGVRIDAALAAYDAAPTCPSCNAPWTEHRGPIAMCKALAALEAYDAKRVERLAGLEGEIERLTAACSEAEAAIWRLHEKLKDRKGTDAEMRLSVSDWRMLRDAQMQCHSAIQRKEKAT